MLDAHDALDMSALMRYRSPIPRGPTYQGVYIDDHVLVQVLPRSEVALVKIADADPSKVQGVRVVHKDDHVPGREPRDRQLSKAAMEQYEACGVAPATSKIVDRALRSVMLGCELDGLRLTAGSPRTTRVYLSALSARLSRRGVASEELAGSLCGLWTSVGLYRRPTLALLRELFLLPRGRGRRVFELTSGARDELLLLSVLAPLFESDLGAQVSTEVYATDASPWRAAAVKTVLPAAATLELYRHCEHRGQRVHLAAGVEHYLDERGLLEVGPDDLTDVRSWAGELFSALQFRGMFAFDIDDPQHININEQTAHRSLLRALCRSVDRQGQRFVYGLDSRVTIGANARGRSPSRPLLRSQRRTLPEVLGGGLYPAYLWLPSALNPADDPSRARPLRRAVADAPPWVRAFLAGDLRAIDRRRGYRADLLVQQGVHPHPGPPREAVREQRAVARRGRSLSGERVLPETQQLRVRLYGEAVARLLARGTNLPQLAQGDFQDIRRLDSALAEFIADEYSSGGTQGDARELLNHVRASFRWVQGLLPQSWDKISLWQEYEPTEHHRPMPVQFLLAIVAAALHGGRVAFALACYLSFACVLRPGESYLLRRRAVLLPSDLQHPHGAAARCAFVVVEKPKRRVGAASARRQFVRLSEDALIEALELYLLPMGREELLFPGGRARFVAEWDLVVGTELHLPLSGADKLTPACLRAGGLTWRFSQTQDLPGCSWMARHRRIETLESYVQEATAAMVLASTSPAATAAVRLWSSVFTSEWERLMDGLRRGAIVYSSTRPVPRRPRSVPPPVVPAGRTPAPQRSGRSATRELLSLHDHLPTPPGGGYWRIL